jgi:hypothetical protein
MKIKTAAGPIYLNASQVQEQFGVTRSRLLTLVATGLVGVYHEKGFMPRFSAQDIEAQLGRDPHRRPRATHPNGTRAVSKANPGPRRTKVKD